MENVFSSCCHGGIIKWNVARCIGFSSKFNYIETQTDLTKQEAYLTEIINNNNKRIGKLEQEIDELTRRLQDTQRQNDAHNKRLFTIENLE